MGEVLEDMLEKAEAQQADGQKAEMVPKSQRCGFGDVYCCGALHKGSAVLC